MRRRATRAIAAALLALPSPVAADPVELGTRAIARFDRPDRPGRVAFLGGVVLQGPGGFGGFSGLLTDGDRLLAVGDTGTWLAARMILDGDRLVGIADAVLSRRSDLDGSPIGTKRRGDAEAILAEGDAVLVLVEGSVELLRYPADGLAVNESATPAAVPVPPTVRAGGRRHGVEAMLTVRGGLVMFAEGSRRTGDTIPAWRVTDRIGAFAVARNGPWSITDAAPLPGGDGVILERRWEGGLEVGMRLRRLGRDALAGGTGVVDGPVLLEADFSAEIDNMEGLAAEVRDGRIVLTAISDDNHSWLQRTLLLRFAVTDPLPRPKPSVSG